MSLLSRFYKPAFRIFLQTLGWLVLFAVVPSAIYAYMEGFRVGASVFLGFSVVAALGLLLGVLGSPLPQEDR